jgi:hypothetical protein
MVDLFKYQITMKMTMMKMEKVELIMMTQIVWLQYLVWRMKEGKMVES